MIEAYPISAQLKIAIGNVAIESNRLETITDVLIYHLSKFDLESYTAFVGGSMLDRKLDMLKALGGQKLKIKKKKAEFATLISKLKSLNSDRNTVIHGAWQPKGGFKIFDLIRGISPTGAEVVHSKRGTPRTMSSERVEQLSLDIHKAASELWSFCMKEFPFRVRKAGSKAP